MPKNKFVAFLISYTYFLTTYQRYNNKRVKTVKEMLKSVKVLECTKSRNHKNRILPNDNSA